MTWNLRNRIVIPTLGLIALLTVAMGVAAFVLARHIVLTSTAAEIERLCQISLRQVESWAETQRNLLQTWAHNPDFVKATQETPEPAVLGKLNETLTHAKGLYGCMEDIQVVNAKGIIITGADQSMIGKGNLATEPYFKAASSGQASFSEVLISKSTGRPVMAVAVPIKDGQTVRGVVVSILDIEWISDRAVTNVKASKTGYAYLYDRVGVIVGYPVKTSVLKIKLAEYDWGRQMLQARKGQVDYTFNGVSKTVAFQSSEILGVSVALTLPRSELNAPLWRMLYFLCAIGAGVLVLGLGIMWVTARSISEPIQQAANSLSAGAEQTTAAAGHVAAASQSLAEASGEQAASIEETSASLEELASMTQLSAENAQKGSQLGRQAREAAEQGVKDMQSMTAAMGAIKNSSDDIANIIKTIDEIAFQTNLLALNAAVEAARAGQAGMGFAVVADEVRSLAHRSAAAAKETAAKIEAAISHAAEGVAISQKVGQSLDEIVAKTRQVDDLGAAAAGASQEQSQGIAQINTAISQMDKVTQGNAASAEESASASEELNGQADAMKHSIARLLELINGSSRMAGASGAKETTHAAKAVSAPKKQTISTSDGPKHKPQRSVKPAPGEHGHTPVTISSCSAIPMEDDFKNF